MADLTVDFSKEKGFFGYDYDKTFEIRTNDFYTFKSIFFDWSIKYTSCALFNHYSDLFEKEFFLQSMQLSEYDFLDIKNDIRGATTLEREHIQAGLQSIGKKLLECTNF